LVDYRRIIKNFIGGEGMKITRIIRSLLKCAIVGFFVFLLLFFMIDKSLIKKLSSGETDLFFVMVVGR